MMSSVRKVCQCVKKNDSGRIFISWRGNERPKAKHQTQLQAVESEPRLWDSG